MNLLTRAGYFFMPPLAFPFTHQIGFVSSRTDRLASQQTHRTPLV